MIFERVVALVRKLMESLMTALAIRAVAHEVMAVVVAKHITPNLVPDFSSYTHESWFRLKVARRIEC
jgi:hypothetical protein